MGVGAAAIMPATLSILMNIFPEDERPKAIAAWAAVSGLGVALGPIIGGLLLEEFSWGSVFLVNIPIVIGALFFAKVLVPESRDPEAPRIDVVGAVLSIVGLTTVVWGLIEASEQGWTDPTILGAFAIGARRPGGVPRLGAPGAAADDRHRDLPQPALQRREPVDHAGLLRPDGHDLHAHDLPADRPGLHRRSRPAIG